jgi:type 1 glutamine amidotransferase
LFESEEAMTLGGCGASAAAAQRWRCLFMLAVAMCLPMATHADDELSTKILLIPTALDHPYATHMYPQVCELLAACLNQTPGVEALVSPDLDWPEDPAVLKGVDAIVYYSRPAGDIVLSPAHREAFLKLMQDGVGFTAIHWSTAAEEAVGPLYERLLGGWFNFAFCGLKVDTLPLVQRKPDHPVCRGWRGYELRDEFYLNLKFDPRAERVLTVTVDDVEQTVAWVLEREGGGRSFGTTLGHFHNNYANPEFRRAIINGILWTAGVDVPEAGAAVELTADVLELPPPPNADGKQ